ncbi:hypothetical protein HZC53_01925 [Candidatus Uhrbacteria bacterium]|nr:hypothetical protein [Candidatus Uhrbacteria bacterium]
MENLDLERRVALLEERLAKFEEAALKPFIVQPSETKKISIKEFIMTKKLDDDVKRTLAIAYFIENIENIKPFNADDLKKAFRSAKMQTPTNINDKINMNIRAGRIMEVDEKKESKKAWELTATGESFVEDMGK